MRSTMQNIGNSLGQNSVDTKSVISKASAFRNVSQDSRLGGSVSGNKQSTMLEQEMKAIEKIKQKQKKEIEQMIDYEMKM